MAEETHAPAAEEEVAAKPPAPEEAAKDGGGDGGAVAGEADQGAIAQSESFKEESNLVSDIHDPEKKALDELKQLIHAALDNNEFAAAGEDSPATAAEEKPAAAAATEEADGAPAAAKEEVFIWGVPLVGDEKSDTVLLKFLRARDFKPKEALAMIKNTVTWRRTFGIEELLEEDLGLPELDRVVFTHGSDRDGHPVCYNLYGEFGVDRDLYAKAFGDEERRKRFLRWRIQFLEREIRQQLDFSPGGGASTIFQVTDLKNSPGPGKRELRLATNQALALLQDNYPEFVAKQVFINVPWWYLAFNRVISPFLTQRTKSKFVFAGPAKSSEILFKYITPEQIPVQYGGLSSKEENADFIASDSVTEMNIKPSTKETIEIPISQAGDVVVWELRVLGWDVSYGAEFTPSAEATYTVILEKARKLVATDEPVVRNTYKVGEPGKIVLTIDNATLRKKKLLYRSKAKSSKEEEEEA